MTAIILQSFSLPAVVVAIVMSQEQTPILASVILFDFLHAHCLLCCTLAP
jgi:hypothetical protein